MPRTIRSAGSLVNLVVGPLVMLMGVGAAITAITLTAVADTPAFLVLLLPAAMGLGAGALLLWMAWRARLRIGTEGLTWSGFLGTSHSLRWEQVHQLLPPPPGAPRTVAIAQLRDGSTVEVKALWQSTTSPAALMGATDHRPIREMLIAAHQQWLADHS